MLELRHWNAWHGHAQALWDVSLQVRPGQLVVLQGLNGAGKSTLIQSVMGLLPRTQGQLFWRGRDLTAMPAHARANAGLGYVAEDRRLFAALTVRENLWVGVTSARRRQAGQRLSDVLSWFPVLGQMMERPAAQMSGGEQQMLALARTWMTSPEVLLLDEPCEGIAPVLVQTMRDALLDLRARGVTLLVAEQNHVLSPDADQVLCMSGGQLTRAGVSMPSVKLQTHP
jgi:branched-chain amino acid transport system ATP-binding protein